MSDDHIVTTWRVQGTAQEVAELLGDVEHYPRWWPAVYLDARVLDPGDEQGLGRLVDLKTRGFVPYPLRWRFQVVELRDDGFAADLWGDFNGRGVWTVEQDGPWTNATYDWT